jgi:integral membrane protein (TIGR01906 family)
VDATPSERRHAIPDILRAFAGVLFVLAVPPALVLTVVRVMVFDPGYYQRGYQRHGVAASTGMGREQLAEATAQVQAYFRGGRPVSLVVQKEWGREPLFNAREQQHLADVRDVLGRAFRAQEASLIYLLGAAVGLRAFRRPAGTRTLARWASAGAGLTLATVAVLGLLVLGDFDAFWPEFHRLWFHNDLRILDARTDYLIRLYPVPFRFEAVIDVALRSAAAAGALLLLAQGYLRWLADSQPDDDRPQSGGLAVKGVPEAAAAAARAEAGDRTTARRPDLRRGDRSGGVISGACIGVGHVFCRRGRARGR